MIEKKEVEKIAKLARINFNAKDLEKFEKELSVILDYFKLLDEVDVSGVSPFFNFSLRGKISELDLASKTGQKNLLSGLGLAREDVVSSFESRKLIDSAPGKEKDYLKVKEVFI